MQFKYMLMGLLFVCLLVPTTLAEEVTIYDYQDARVVYTGVSGTDNTLPMFFDAGTALWQLSDVMFNISELSGYNITNATLILYGCYYNANSPYNNMAGTDIFNVSNHTWIPSTAPGYQGVANKIGSNTTTQLTVSFDVATQLQSEIDLGYSNITFQFQQNTTTSGYRQCDSKQTPSPELPRIILYGEAPPTPTTLQQYPILGVIPVVIACAMLLVIVGSVVLSPKLDLKVIITAGIMLMLTVIMMGVLYTV